MRNLCGSPPACRPPRISFVSLLGVIAVSLLPMQVLAADSHDSHHAMPAAAGASTEAMYDGRVTKLDAAAGKVTIKHGPMKALGMPAMTMTFKAKDAALLKGVKAGDSIGFGAEQTAGELLVTQIVVKK